jgi:hypothetical protein
VGAVELGKAPGRVVAVVTQRQLPQRRERGVDHLPAGAGGDLEHPVRVYPFASSHVSPVPTSTASGGSRA